MFTGTLAIVNIWRYALAKTIALVMYNLNTHRPGALYEAFEPDQVKSALGSVRIRLHVQARQMAEHGRSTDQHHVVPVLESQDRLQ